MRTTTSYDDAGQQETSTDALGAVTHYSYDDVGHVTKTVADMFGLQVTTEAHYDTLGRRNWAKDALGQMTDYQYDDLGRLREVDLPRVDSGVTGSITGIAAYQYDYDLYGNQIRTRDPMDNDLAGGFVVRPVRLCTTAAAG